MYMSSSATCRPEDSTKGQTRRKAGTQSHGTHAVSRATEREGTRWLFVVLVLASLLLTLPAPLTAANGTLRLVAVAGAVVLGLSWGAGYLRLSAPLAMDLVDTVALLAFALASPEPTIVFPLVFAALWFRSLYGSGRRAVLRCGLYAGALGASPPLWP